MKALFHTLGCKLNFAETATMQRLLAERGILTVSSGEVPDLCVINTCSVTSVADKKARTLIRGLARKYPDAKIIVTGCYAQLKPQEVAALPGVAMVLGTDEKGRFGEFIDRWLDGHAVGMSAGHIREIKDFHGTCERGERTRFFLKVQDGCDYYCTYCTIPMARGRSRSGTIAEMVSLARQAAERGGKEIVLTGVNVGEFGKDHGEDLFSLLKALDGVEGVERFRISSIEPNLLSEEIIHWVAFESEKFMPHFHIPLQSGSDEVLRLMKRRYDTSLYASRIDLIRRFVPHAFIGVDIIAGARGETFEEWVKSYDFVKNLDVSAFHVFPYSEREGTRALMLGNPVSREERYQRVAQLTELSLKKAGEFTGRNMGTERKVLWENKTAGGKMTGLTDNYIRVTVPLDSEKLNTVTAVTLSPDMI